MQEEKKARREERKREQKVDRAENRQGEERKKIVKVCGRLEVEMERAAIGIPNTQPMLLMNTNNNKNDNEKEREKRERNEGRQSKDKQNGEEGQ